MGDNDVVMGSKHEIMKGIFYDNGIRITVNHR